MPSDGQLAGHVLRARHTAALARAAMAVAGLAVIVASPGLAARPALAGAGFVVIALSAAVQLAEPGPRWLSAEESLAGVAGLLIVGLGEQRVDVLQTLWLAAVAAGVLARGGRVHWIGRTVVLCALALPIVLSQSVALSHLGLCVAAVALLLTCGRVTNELRHLLDRARHEADHDALTGLLSRTAFRVELARRDLTDLPETGLLIVDLDGFGQVNKLHGHAAGDEVLAGAAERVRAVAGPDAVVGRLGGDELAAIVPGERAATAAAEVAAALSRPLGPVTLGASIGVARSPGHGQDAEALLRAADVALRVAKRSGRGQIQAYRGEDVGKEGPTGARGALERLIRGEGLSMEVQPIVDWRAGRVHAFEALARFRTRSGAGPLSWFALADEFSLRDELELACLGAALELFDARPAGVALNVNLSGRVLLDSRSGELMLKRRDLSGLVIEVTEEALVRYDAALAAATEPLLERGAVFAVDDIGAGYSGLRQITALRTAYLKLDRALVQELEDAPLRLALVEALLGFAERTGALLVAEGVESAPEFGALAQLGVPLIQGFLLGRPAPPWPELAAMPVRLPASLA